VGIKEILRGRGNYKCYLAKLTGCSKTHVSREIHGLGYKCSRYKGRKTEDRGAECPTHSRTAEKECLPHSKPGKENEKYQQNQWEKKTKTHQERSCGTKWGL